MSFVGKAVKGIFGGGSSGSTQVVKQDTKPFAEQLPFSLRSFQEALDQLNQGPMQFFPGQTVAPTDPSVTAGQQAQLGAIPGISSLAALQRGAVSRALAPIDPANDPTIQRFADAATRPLFQQFQEQILPQIGSRAVAQGAFGGSRQAIQEGQAAEGLARATGDIRAGIFNNALAQQLQQQRAGLALTPQVAQQQLLPGQVQSDIGLQRQAQQQALIDAQRERFEFEQNAPFLGLQRFSSIVQGVPGSSSAQTSTAPGVSPIRAGIGGSLTGATLGSLIPGLGAGTGGLIGGGLGLLGLL